MLMIARVSAPQLLERQRVCVAIRGCRVASHRMQKETAIESHNRLERSRPSRCAFDSSCTCKCGRPLAHQRPRGIKPAIDEDLHSAQVRGEGPGPSPETMAEPPASARCAPPRATALTPHAS